MKLLLDTNRLSDALAMVSEVLDALEMAEEIYVPVVALGEIRAGFLRGSRPRAAEYWATAWITQTCRSTSRLVPTRARKSAGEISWALPWGSFGSAT